MGLNGISRRSIRLDAIGDVAALPGRTAGDDPNVIHKLREEYPIKTEPRLTDSNQEHRELAIEGNGVKIVVADRSILTNPGLELCGLRIREGEPVVAPEPARMGLVDVWRQLGEFAGRSRAAGRQALPRRQLSASMSR